MFYGELELRERHPHLDVLRLGEQLAVEVPGLVRLVLLDLKVDVGLPQDLGHVEARLVDGQLVDATGTIDVAYDDTLSDSDWH